MKELTSEMFSDILSKSDSQYFFHKEDTGEVTIVFRSGIRKVEPGEEDSAGRIWNPKLVDANGNPMLDFKGNPKEPWTKFEAEVTIDGAPNIYSFAGEKSSILRSFIMAMNKEGISNNDLPGTKWTIDRIGKWDWKIMYVGREDNSSPSNENTKLSPDIEKIREALRVKRDQSPEGLTENDFTSYISFVLHRKFDEVKPMISILIENKLIEKRNNLIYIM